jgi:hypothetical protein
MAPPCQQVTTQTTAWSSTVPFRIGGTRAGGMLALGIGADFVVSVAVPLVFYATARSSASGEATPNDVPGATANPMAAPQDVPRGRRVHH